MGCNSSAPQDPSVLQLTPRDLATLGKHDDRVADSIVHSAGDRAAAAAAGAAPAAARRRASAHARAREAAERNASRVQATDYTSGQRVTVNHDGRELEAIFVRTYSKHDVVVRLVGGEDAPAPAPARSRPRRAASAGARARAVTGLGPGETRVRRSAIVGHVSQIAARASNAGFTVDAYRARAEERRAAAAATRRPQDGDDARISLLVQGQPGGLRWARSEDFAGACPFGLATFASVKDAHDAAGALRRDDAITHLDGGLKYKLLFELRSPPPQPVLYELASRGCIVC